MFLHFQNNKVHYLIKNISITKECLLQGCLTHVDIIYFAIRVHMYACHLKIYLSYLKAICRLGPIPIEFVFICSTYFVRQNL